MENPQLPATKVTLSGLALALMAGAAVARLLHPGALAVAGIATVLACRKTGGTPRHGRNHLQPELPTPEPATALPSGHSVPGMPVTLHAAEPEAPHTTAWDDLRAAVSPAVNGPAVVTGAPTSSAGLPVPALGTVEPPPPPSPLSEALQQQQKIVHTTGMAPGGETPESSTSGETQGGSGAASVEGLADRTRQSVSGEAPATAEAADPAAVMASGSSSAPASAVKPAERPLAPSSGTGPSSTNQNPNFRHPSAGSFSADPYQAAVSAPQSSTNGGADDSSSPAGASSSLNEEATESWLKWLRRPG